jgi:hypothetical protein
MKPSVHGKARSPGLSAAIRSSPPISSHAARHTLGANVLSSMSSCEAMWIDGRAHVDWSSGS